MPRIVEAWHLEGETTYLHARSRGRRLYALGACSELIAVDVDEGSASTAWRYESSPLSVRSFALGEELLFAAGRLGDRLRLVARSLSDGSPAWQVPIEAKRVGRIFANDKGRIFLAVHQAGRLGLEIRNQEDGELLDTLRLTRRRLMVSRNGAWAWTRDREGITELQLVTREKRETHVGSNGFMVEVEDGLVIGAGSRVLRLARGTVRWVAEIPSRDLSAVAAADGLGDEEDVWDPDLGRLVRFGSHVVVGALNGSLHALDLETGQRAWTVESAHYPGARRVAAPAPITFDEREHLLFPASDEELYLVDDEGGVHARHELPLPFENVAVSMGATVVLPFSGLRGYVVQL